MICQGLAVNERIDVSRLIIGVADGIDAVIIMRFEAFVRLYLQDAVTSGFR
jgi:hypothetical protein